MTPTRWQQVKHVLERAIEVTGADRDSFLTDACSGDDDLRREVESLLEGDDEKSQLLEKDALATVVGNGKNLVGLDIGRYRILDKLGSGGMGTVYLAERSDGTFEQKVALKVINRGMDSDAIVRRFINERQILASLEHPNIAHLIDGGTTDDGLPFFVLEYVEGETITAFARARNLSVEERLDLFREVCSAVAFAHKNLVIHRDLKPSNILVNAHGVPKLLDFGIAKLLKTSATDQTATQHFAFTPEYASPEQVMGEKLTTATDVYSLGVILYELLTDRRPFSFDQKNFGQIVKTITTSEPVRPSAVTGDENAHVSIDSRRLKGDLDNIILKALKRDADRRYASVDRFADDIRRHLKGLPVAARRDTFGYRADKFVRRNPLVAAAAALTLLILGAGLGGVAWQARIANIEREKAERRFNDVRTLANSFMFEINEEMAKSPIKARELLVTRAIEYLDKLAAESGGDAELERELATAYEKIGTVQSELFKPSAGKTSDALVSHKKSLEIRERLFQLEAGSIDRGLELARSRVMVGDILSMSGRVGEGAESYRQAIALNEKLLAMDLKNPSIRRSLAGNHSRLGQAVLRSGSLGSALASYNNALEIYQELSAENPDEPLHARSLGIIYSYIGYVKIEMGARDEAVRFFEDALTLTERSVGDAETSSEAQNRLVSAGLWLGVALTENERHDESIAQIRQALAMQESVFKADRENLGEQNGFADCHLELGRAIARKAQSERKPALLPSAISAYNTAIENYDAVWRTDRENLSTRRQIAFARKNLADAWALKGENSRALELFLETLRDLDDLTGKDPNNTEWRHDLAYCHLRIGELAASADAKTHSTQALTLLISLAALSPENARIKTDLAAARRLANRGAAVQ